MNVAACFRIIVWALVFTVAVSMPSAAKIYKYQRSDGTWVFTDDPGELPEDAQTLYGGGVSGLQGPAVDLTARLTERFRPRTDVERATLATVVVQSGVGRGSGFFVSEEGHILTNRHVIRTPESKKKFMEKRGEQVEMKISEYEKKFAAEQQRLDVAKEELESYRGRLHPRSYTRKKAEFEAHQQDLDHRKAEFEAEADRIRDQLGDEEYQDRIANIERYFTVLLADRSELRAYLVAVSDRMDLALLKIDGHRTPKLAPAAPYSVPTGGRVYAIGNPIALHHSVSQGVLSGYEQGYIKTDAKIYPGNSGGPLVSEGGKVLGVNTFKKLTRQYEGLGFAIPVQAALKEFGRYLDGVN